MKITKTWGIIGGCIGAALLITATLIGSTKLGVLAVLALLVLRRLVRGPSGDTLMIGVDHRDRPRGSSYGGGFAPGGLYGVSGLGSHFGVYGTSLADSSPEAFHQGRGPSYVAADVTALSKKQRGELAAAIKETEARTGHQILAAIGPLDGDHAAKADQIAAQWPAASIVVCIDPARRVYELRWHDASFALDAAHVDTFVGMARRSEYASALALLAEVLPVQPAVTDLPDIVDGE